MPSRARPRPKADPDPGRVLLIDTYALFYRAHFALPPMSTLGGEPTSALYGFAALMLKLFREERPAGAAFALDLPRPTFRHRAYPAYKGTRLAIEDRLGRQLQRLAELLGAFGFPLLAEPGFEADDVLATAAHELNEAGERPLVVTGDLDLLQVARPPCEVLLVSRAPAQAARYDEPAVIRRFGVCPGELPLFTALVGDPSDNLPGVPGVGPRRAATLVQRFGQVDRLLDGLADVQPTTLRRSLEEHRDELRLWADLARLRDDVPLQAEPRWSPLDAEAFPRLRVLFELLEFRSLLPRLDALERAEDRLPDARARSRPAA